MNLNSFVLNSAGILVRSTYQVTPEYVRRSDDLPADVVIGMMFGDEGKGKIVDSLPGHGIRFNGGHNAGHTLIILINGKWVEFDLHIVPSSIVDPSKIAIIARTCVVGIDLPKLRKRNEKDTSDTYEMWNKGDYTSIICPHSLDTLQGRREDGSLIRVGVMPELEQVQNKGVDPNGRLFISRYASMIGVHHVLMDALSEEIRNRLEVRKLGSTGSGIAPAYGKTFDILDHALQYTTKIKNDEYQTLARELEKLNEERKDITIEYALRNPNGYTAFVEREWNLIKKYFPKVSFDEIKKENNKQIALLRGRIDTGAIYLCDERELIKSRIEKGEKFVGEGAQAALISESHSIWGTKSNANIEAFCEATGIMPAQIANVFTVMKLPPSSVGTRPIDFMKYIETDVLKALRQKYQEFGVSTGRPRDIVKISLVEIARAVELIMKGMDQKMRDRIVPVLNRVDGLQDFATLTDGNIPFVTGYTHSVGGTPIHIGLRSSELGGSREIPITPSNLLANYPTREQINHPDMFDIQRASVLEGTLSGDMPVTNEKLGDTIRYTIEYILAAMFEGNGPREVIVGTGKRREDLALVKGLGPSRSFL